MEEEKVDAALVQALENGSEGDVDVLVEGITDEEIDEEVEEAGIE